MRTSPIKFIFSKIFSKNFGRDLTEPLLRSLYDFSYLHLKNNKYICIFILLHKKEVILHTDFTKRKKEELSEKKYHDAGKVVNVDILTI